MARVVHAVRVPGIRYPVRMAGVIHAVSVRRHFSDGQLMSVNRELTTPVPAAPANCAVLLADRLIEPHRAVRECRISVDSPSRRRRGLLQNDARALRRVERSVVHL
ncbi:hypothetical protein, partial [Burkholderia multivorans]|uniref:hypothetical protein n=1 Tax=Burkholderia multivorans TaxID=87883 RepID=UPI00286FEF30